MLRVQAAKSVAPACRVQQRGLHRCSAFQGVAPDRGFLPEHDPIARLPGEEYAAWEDALDLIPKLSVVAGRGELRQWLEGLPDFPAAPLTHPDALHIDGARERQWRAYSVLSFLAHAYLWCDGPGVPAVLPAKLAVPWVAVAAALDMPPVLTYATYNLLNWRRLDPAGPVALGNIVCLNNFLGGVDEEWFRLVHIEIEATAAPVVASLPALQAALLARHGDAAPLARDALHAVTAALGAMSATLGRMGEKVDPHIYYHRVRRPMSGSRSNAELPGGLVYAGCFGGAAQRYYGETGAQSTILHALDAVLGVEHEEGSTWLRPYLQEMRAHMPPVHRGFVAALESGPSLRDVAREAPAALREDYNNCIAALEAFRAQHRAFAGAYIASPGRKAAEGAAQDAGTGGSEFMPALLGYQEATARHRLP